MDVNLASEISMTTGLANIQNPFELKATFGFEKTVGVRPIRDSNNELNLIYCMSNIVCVFNAIRKSYQYVTGHAHRIRRMVLSAEERILVSIDTRNLHIWNLKNADEEKPCILKVIKDPFGKNLQIAEAAISSCTKYLLLVSELCRLKRNNDTAADDSEEDDVFGYKVSCWDWSYDKEYCDDTTDITEPYGCVKNIQFDCNEDRYTDFVITFEEKVIFGSIDAAKKICLHKCTARRCNNSLLSTCFTKNSTYAVSAITSGKIILWADEGCGSDGDAKSTEQKSNTKVLHKSVALKKTLIDLVIIDDYIVVIDCKRDVTFYDIELKLLYICCADDFNLGHSRLLSIWPSAIRREYKIKDDKVIISDEDGEQATIPFSKCIQNYSMQAEPFVVRKFFLVNEGGELAMIDVVRKKYQQMLPPAEDSYVAMDIYPQKCWMIGCTRGNRISISNYGSNNTIARYHFQPKDKPVKGDRPVFVKSVASCIKVSHNENFIALGFENGHLWMLDPVTGKETHDLPMKFCQSAVRKIVFNKENNNFCALADNTYFLTCINFDGVSWQMHSKFKYHCMPIIGIFFLKYLEHSYIITVGYDRMYVRYKANCWDIEDGQLQPDIDVRLDQAPKLTAVELLQSKILANDTSKSGSVLIVANNYCKFVVYDAISTENLFTFLGPMFESPLQKIIFCSARFETDESPLLLFISKKCLGAAVLPLDGNPFRYSGILAHHTEITVFELHHDFSGVLLYGEGDIGPTYWEIKQENMYKKLDFGGDGLEPFLKLLPGGKYGNFFNEMIQFFYYIQLMEDATDDVERKAITEYIKVSEVVDYMRAVGFFPSEYEAKNLIGEVSRVTPEYRIAPPTHISFTDLIKLYFNHRPIDGYQFSKILESLKFVLSGKLRFAISDDDIRMNVVNRDRLLDAMTTKGEKITEVKAMRYILELLDGEASGGGIKRKAMELSDAQVMRNFEKLPFEINMSEFCYKVFGMQMHDAAKMINIFEKCTKIEATESNKREGQRNNDNNNQGGDDDSADESVQSGNHSENVPE